MHCNALQAKVSVWLPLWLLVFQMRAHLEQRSPLPLPQCSMA